MKSNDNTIEVSPAEMQMLTAKMRQEFDAAEKLGRQIGYGNLMSLASALWRRDLKRQSLPVDGAFVPTIKLFLKEEEIDRLEREEAVYDQWADKIYGKI